MTSVHIVSQPDIVIAGMHVRATMDNISALAGKLWHEMFGPRIAEIKSTGQGECYGASWAANESPDPAEDSFDYWAAMPVATDYTPPAGMSVTLLPAGLYACMQVPSLAVLKDAYHSIIQDWLPEHPEYAILMTAPSYELYPPDFMHNGALVLYFPVYKVQR